MGFKCKWLPKIIELSDFDGNWNNYNDKLYEIFLNDFINKKLEFKGKKVLTRKQPQIGKYEHGFIHLTTVANPESKDINDRLPDLRRSERIGWNKQIIKNYLCNDSDCNCRKIYYYEQKYKNTVRINLVFVDARYKVVLEERFNYYLLITGYYIEYDYIIKKEIKRTTEYEKQKAPIDKTIDAFRISFMP